MLLGELNPDVTHEWMSTGMDEFGVIFIQHLFMDQVRVLGLSREGRGKERQLYGKKNGQDNGREYGHTGSRIGWESR